MFKPQHLGNRVDFKCSFSPLRVSRDRCHRLGRHRPVLSRRDRSRLRLSPGPWPPSQDFRALGLPGRTGWSRPRHAVTRHLAPRGDLPRARLQPTRAPRAHGESRRGRAESCDVSLPSLSPSPRGGRCEHLEVAPSLLASGCQPSFGVQSDVGTVL